MQQAMRTAQEYKEAIETPINEDEFKRHMDSLKPHINNMLFMYLPDDITLAKINILSMVINDIICYPEKYLNQSNENI